MEKYKQMMANAAFAIPASKWRGLQPRNPFKGGRYVFTPEQYSEYCASHSKAERKERKGRVPTEKSDN